MSALPEIKCEVCGERKDHEDLTECYGAMDAITDGRAIACYACFRAATAAFVESVTPDDIDRFRIVIDALAAACDYGAIEHSECTALMVRAAKRLAVEV